MKQKTYKIVAIIISVIVAAVLTLCIIVNSVPIKIAFSSSKPTPKDYEVLKEYALSVAKGETTNIEDGVKIEKYLDNSNSLLQIRIEAPRKYGVEMGFPINSEMSFENGNIKIIGKINFDDCSYREYSEVGTRTLYIVINFFAFIIFCYAVYSLIYALPVEFVRMQKKQKNT